MNKILKGLLVTLFMVGCAQASQDNNKTHLNTRLGRDNVIALTTFNALKSEEPGDRFGANLQLTGFYGRTTNGSHLAKNFGADGTETISVVASNATSVQNLGTLGRVVPSGLLLHEIGASNAVALKGTMRFSPRQLMYGARLDYYQNLDKYYKGLFVEACIPFIHAQSSINLTTENETPHAEVATQSNKSKIYIKDLFSGNLVREVTGASNAQKNATEKLKYAKMCTNSKTSLGDVEAKVGYKFMEHADYDASVKAILVLPTGSKPMAEYLFSARTGESKFGLGASVDASTVLWEEKDENFRVFGSLQYKFLFNGTEKRTLGLNKFDYVTSVDTVFNHSAYPILSHYYLVGENGKAGLNPLANISTLNLSVKPGSQLEGNVMFSYNNGGFCLDFGYNMFWKQAERVTIKSGQWKANTYGIAKFAYEADGDFDAQESVAESTNTDLSFIAEKDLFKEGAESAAQLVHKAFLGVGYTAKTWEYPIMVGAGVSYDIPANNRDAAEGYMLWAKAGIAF